MNVQENHQFKNKRDQFVLEIRKKKQSDFVKRKRMKFSKNV
jgi:hypothetical protein